MTAVEALISGRTPSPDGPFPVSGSPVLMGHRGSGRGLSPLGHPENTLASMLEAVAAGATWIELDVQATKDGVLLLVHNIAPEPGRTVAEQTLAALGDHG